MIWKLLLISFGFASAQATKYVDPEYLDELWGSEKDEEFAKILNIKIDQVRPDTSAVAYAGSIPKNESYFCDFILPKEEKGINFLNLRNKLWTGGDIPYFISKNSYNDRETQFILDAINDFNEMIRNVKLVPYKGQKDYVFVFSGKGCAVFGDLGRKVGPNALSLQTNRCLRKPGMVQHEFMHAAGVEHEHNRYDRDEYIKLIKYNIIAANVLGQFKKSKSTDSLRLGHYDYYSVMHYPIQINPGQPLFKILKQGIDKSRVGQYKVTDTDIRKIDKLYS